MDERNTTRSLPQRGELPPEQTWDVASIFPSSDAWEAAYQAGPGRIAELAQFRGRLGESADTLLAGLRLRDEVERDVYRVALYANLRVAEDATNSASLALSDRAGSLWAQTMAAASFFEPEILAIEPARLNGLLLGAPELRVYAHYLERLQRRRAHVRSAEVEEVLALAGEPLGAFDAVHTALTDADLQLGRITDDDGNVVELGQGNLETYIHSPSRQVREAAWETSADAYLSMKHTLAANYAGAVKRDVLLARTHRYGSSLEAALAPDAIPHEVFYNLLDTVWKNLPTWQRYFRARAELLGIEQAHAWDISESPLQPANAAPQRTINSDGMSWTRSRSGGTRNGKTLSR